MGVVVVGKMCIKTVNRTYEIMQCLNPNALYPPAALSGREGRQVLPGLCRTDPLWTQSTEPRRLRRRRVLVPLGRAVPVRRRLSQPISALGRIVNACMS